MNAPSLYHPPLRSLTEVDLERTRDAKQIAMNGGTMINQADREQKQDADDAKFDALWADWDGKRTLGISPDILATVCRLWFGRGIQGVKWAGATADRVFERDEPIHIRVLCSYPGCDKLTTFDPVYGDLCYEHCRCEND